MKSKCLGSGLLVRDKGPEDVFLDGGDLQRTVWTGLKDSDLDRKERHRDKKC